MTWAEAAAGRRSTAAARAATGRSFFMQTSRISVGEDVAFGLAVTGHERVQDLALEREQVLEEALKLVGAPTPGLPEVLELVLEELLSRVTVEDEQHDVEEKPGLLDVDLAV